MDLKGQMKLLRWGLWSGLEKLHKPEGQMSCMHTWGIALMLWVLFGLSRGSRLRGLHSASGFVKTGRM